MTTQSITSYTVGQERQLSRFAEDSVRSAVHDALKELKLSKAGAQRVVSSDEFAGSIYNETKDLIRRLSTEPISYATAQAILGVDFITPEEVIKQVHPSRAYNEIEIRALAEAVPSEEILHWCKDNSYAVIPAPPSDLPLLLIYKLQPEYFYSKTGGRFGDQEFARKDKTSFGWLAIRKTPIPNSRNRTWSEQQQLLSALEHVPNVAEMSWFLTTYFSVRGVRLFGDVYVRTSSLDSDGDRVSIGYFDAKGLIVYYWNGGIRDDDVGLSAARKF